MTRRVIPRMPKSKITKDKDAETNPPRSHCHVGGWLYAGIGIGGLGSSAITLSQYASSSALYSGVAVLNSL